MRTPGIKRRAANADRGCSVQEIRRSLLKQDDAASDYVAYDQVTNESKRPPLLQEVRAERHHYGMEQAKTGSWER